MRRALFSFLLSLSLGAISGLFSTAGAASPLFKTFVTTTSLEKGVKRERSVQLQTYLLKSIHPGNFQSGKRPSLRLNLFDDVDLTLVSQRAELRPGGRVVVTGTFEGIPGGLGVLTYQQGIATGIFYVPGKGMFKLLPAPNGTHRVREVDEDQGFGCALDPAQPIPSDPKLQASLPQEGLPYLIPNNYPAGCANALNPTVVDLMVLYTPAALSVIGSVPAMESLIDTVVFYNNMVYYNNGINVQLRLVHSSQIAFVESGSFYTDLGKLDSGAIPGVLAQRNIYGADLVAMWVAGKDPVMGLAQMPGNYSCEHVSFAESMIHEVGHNFGCGHDTANGGPGLYSFSSGNRFMAKGVQYRTIMAYAPGVYSPYFSSPLATYLGTTTGTVTKDNARTINLTAATVAASEPTLATLPTVSITSPADASVFTGPLNLTLTAAASGSAPIAQVDFFVDSQFLGSSTSAPYSMNWPFVPSGSHFITAHAIDTNGTGQFSCPVSIYVNSTLPSPWVEQDIGWLMQTSAVQPPELRYMGLLGSGSYSSGTFQVNGAGAGLALNLTGTEQDSLQFVNQSLCGSVTFTARLSSLNFGGNQNEAGLMIRDNSASLSPYVFMGVSDNGARLLFAWRGTQGGNTQVALGVPLSLPLWLQVTRVGNLFTGLSSPDGITWTQVGQAIIAMNPNPMGGFAVSSDQAPLLATADFDNVILSMPCGPPTPTPTITPTPTNSPTLTPSATPTPTPPVPPTFTFTPVPGGCCASGSDIISVYAGNEVTSGYAGDGGPATSALLGSRTSSVHMDNAGNLFFTDTNNNVVRKVSNTGIITTIAGTGTAGYSGDGGPGPLAALDYPSFACLDPAGEFIFCDSFNYRIRKVSSTGIITTIAGTGVSGYSGDGGLATSAQIGLSYGVACDAAGNIYVGDTGNSRIRKINAAGIITTIAGTGVGGYSGDGGPAISAQISSNEDLVIDPAGNLYFNDDGNSRIRKIDTTGIITTFAGNGISGFAGDGGPATSARIGDAHGMAFCGGNAYIGDSSNGRVREVNAAGIIQTIMGNGGGDSGNGGPASAAGVGALALCFDNAGNMYIGGFFPAVRIVSVSCAGTPTSTPTNTPTSTPTNSPTFTPTSSPTDSPTPTGSPSETPTNTQPVDLPIATTTPTNTPTLTPTSTFTSTFTMTFTYTPTVTTTFTPTSTPTCQIQVWPDPFLPRRAVNGTLKFGCIPDGAMVSLYTLSGEKVVDLNASGGMANWNGRNDRTNLVSSGIYYYLIRSGGTTLKAGKVLLLQD